MTGPSEMGFPGRKQGLQGCTAEPAAEKQFLSLWILEAAIFWLVATFCLQSQQRLLLWSPLLLALTLWPPFDRDPVSSLRHGPYLNHLCRIPLPGEVPWPKLLGLTACGPHSVNHRVPAPRELGLCRLSQLQDPFPAVQPDEILLPSAPKTCSSGH